MVRHGQTAANSRQLLQGRSDYPLNETGREQAAAAAEMLSGIRFSKVYSSPLVRAVQTARIIAPYEEPVTDPRLLEMDYGPYEGTDLNNLPPEIRTFFSDFVHNEAPHGMEPLGSVVARTGTFLEELCRVEEPILISTHAIALKGFLEYLTPESGGSWWSRYVGNCAVFVTEYTDGGFSRPQEVKRALV